MTGTVPIGTSATITSPPLYSTPRWYSGSSVPPCPSSTPGVGREEINRELLRWQNPLAEEATVPDPQRPAEQTLAEKLQMLEAQLTRCKEMIEKLDKSIEEKRLLITKTVPDDKNQQKKDRRIDFDL